LICPIDITSIEWAEKVLHLQFLSYAIEAQIIGFADLPPLKDTVQTLQQSGERFYGFFMNGELAGVISYERVGERVQICRLMVHPDFFRHGIGGALVKFICDVERDTKEIIVTTGTANTPAINLYQRHGFQEMERIEVAEGVSITKLMKRISR
jgi:ribosomal protein S18 acetylase RimI-like enzyme